jgi:hypothetical protein
MCCEKDVRAEATGGTRERDAPADRRGGGRPPHHRRPSADDDRRDREACGRKLFEACSSHWSALHPLPDAERERWSATGDAESRLRAALDDLYAWYEEAGDDVALFRRDARTHATTAEVLAADDARLTSLRDALLAGWPRRKAVRAAVSHALELETWQSLVQRHGLTRQQAVDAMIRFVASV